MEKRLGILLDPQLHLLVLLFGICSWYGVSMRGATDDAILRLGAHPLPKYCLRAECRDCRQVVATYPTLRWSTDADRRRASEGAIRRRSAGAH